MPNSKLLTKERAVEIATADSGGFLGTWVRAELKDGNWHVSASSKSDNPPVLYIIDAVSGEIIYKNLNVDEN